MFRSTPKDLQFNIFSNHHSMFSGKSSKQYEDPHGWHNLFRKHVTMRIDESIFRPLYCENNGCPNSSIRLMIAMMVLKEAECLSDAKIFEQARFNVLVRSALGLVNMSDSIPAESTYYRFRQLVNDHAKETGVNLFDELFSSITKEQSFSFNVSGKSIRMDSKLLGSNIAYLSRYELVHETLRLFYKNHKAHLLLDQTTKDQLTSLLKIDGNKVVYNCSSNEVKSKLLQLGFLIQSILPHIEQFQEQSATTLKQVFEEQFTVDENGTVLSKDASEISAKSIQSPHDTDADFRNKNNDKTKGYSINVTESCSDENDLNLISSIEVEKATTSDTSFFQTGTQKSTEVFQEKPTAIHVDGAYHSSDNQEYCSKNNIALYLNAIQGAKGRYELLLIDQHRLLVYDHKEETFVEAKEITSKKNCVKWRINTPNGYRYFTQKEIDTCKLKRKITNTPKEILQKRNNVEATIFQMGYHYPNGKTRYRGQEKNQMWANIRGLWVNYVRILKFKVKNTLNPIFFAFLTQKTSFRSLFQRIWNDFFKICITKNFAIS